MTSDVKSALSTLCNIKLIANIQGVIQNNYVGKKRGKGSVESSHMVTRQRVGILQIVHNCPVEEGGGQNWVKFGPRSC